jgi:hypothetical protein
MNQYNGNIIITSTHVLSDGIRFGSNGGSATLANTRTITVGGGGYIAGQLRLRNFLQAGGTAQNLTLTGTGFIYNYDSNWGGDVNFSAPRINTRGTTYNGNSTLSKTGASDDNCSGGNTFIGNCTLNNSGTGYFLMGNGTADTWQANLTMNNSSTDNMYIAHGGAGHSIAGNLIANNTTSGGTTVNYFATNGNSTLSITGNATLSNTGASSNSQMVFANNGDITVGGDLNITSNASGTNGYFYVASGTSSSVNISGNTTVSNNGAGTTKRIYFGNNGDIICSGNLNISNSSSANNSQIYLNHAANSMNVYNGNIRVESTHVSCDGILFGNAGGSATLAAGRNINTFGGGFIAGDMQLRNMTQLGSNASTLSLSGSARFYAYASTFGGSMNVESPRFYNRSSTYSNGLTLNYIGTVNETSYGGNTFNGNVSYTHNGSSRIRLANNVANDYNADVTFTRNSGTLQPTYNHASTFAGDITVNCNTEVTLGAGNGRVILDGNSDQNFTDGGTTSNFTFRRLTINKPGGSFILSEPLRIQTTAEFTQGIVQSSSGNEFIFEDESTVSGANNSSYVRGPVDKIGNNAFEFPVGDSSLYRPLSMSAPSSNSAQFRATYFHTDPSASYDWMSKDPTVHHISTTEYWTLDRIASTNNVSVTLSWDANSGGVDNLTDLTVIRWDGSTWKDHGNGGTTGNTTAGTIVSSGSISSFSPFTLGSSSSNNPLPVTLVDFRAEADFDNHQVLLNWETVSELNNDYFIVEKTTDLMSFTAVDRIAGAGTTNEFSFYNTIDNKPNEGISYYRLSQVDFDGTKQVYELKKVEFNSISNTNEFNLFPNPLSKNTFFISLPMDISISSSTVNLIDNTGKIIETSLEISQIFSSTIKVVLHSPLPNGLYKVRVVSQDGTHTENLVIQH